MKIYESGTFPVSLMRVLAFTLLLCCVIPNTCVYGIEIKSDKAHVGLLNPIISSADASGQGTHTNFRDPQGIETVNTVVDLKQKTNRWVSITYNYFASGFKAKFAEEDNIDAGVTALASLSYSQASWEGQKSGYVYDGVTARSNIIFEFMFITNSTEIPKTIPVSIGINIELDVMTESDDDFARAYADIRLYQDSTMLRSFWIKRTAEEGKEPVTTPENLDEVPISSGATAMIGDGEQVHFSFIKLQLEPYKRYRLLLDASASASGVFKPEDTTGGALAITVVDPSIHISPDFPNPEDYIVLVSPGLIDENLGMDPQIALSMLQKGEEVTQIDVNGGPVSMVAPTELEQNFTTRYLWSATDPNFIDIDGEPFDSSYTFNPEEIQPGTYTVHLLTFPPMDPERGSITFEVVSEPQSEPEPQPKPGIIPGFTIESVVLGIIVGVLIYLMMQIRR